MRRLSNGPPKRPACLARLLQCAQWVLLATGFTSLAVYGAARVHGVLGRAQALESFTAQKLVGEGAARDPHATRPMPPARDDALPQLGEPDQSLWDKGRIAAYRRTLRAASSPPIGVLSIPTLALQVPIFEGTGELALNRGVGRIEGTAEIEESGNLGIAGHRDGFFRVLKDIELDAQIDVRSLDGTRRYRVTEILIVEPTDVHVLDPTDRATLTLVTCYPFYFLGEAPQRYIVKATLVS